MDPAQISAVSRDVSVTMILLFALVGGYKGVYVWRWYYDERIAALAAVTNWKGLS